jgi:ribosomal protein S18 acetylase RimI-like enzyme
MEIREFDPSRDLESVRGCFVQLQNVERSIRPGMPPGEQIADAYLDLMFRRCREFDGAVLVAEERNAVVGFVTVWTKYRSDEPDDDPAEHGFISDLVVSSANRGSGIGRALLCAAEARAREAGARVIRLSVIAGNVAAVSLYMADGFRESEIYLEKDLL